MNRKNIPGTPGCIAHPSVYLNHRVQTYKQQLYDRLRRLPESSGAGWWHNIPMNKLKLMADLLWEYAQLTVDLFLNQSKRDRP